jgi:hypothetical protein
VQCHVCIIFTSGVGIFANDNPASNNSVLLADRNNQIGTVYCSSGSRSGSIGQWLAPNGATIAGRGTSLSVVRGGGNYPAYVGLQLRANQSLSPSDEGVYTCRIPDENGVQKTLHVGIYRYGYYGALLMHSNLVRFEYGCACSCPDNWRCQHNYSPVHTHLHNNGGSWSHQLGALWFSKNIH